MRQTPGKDRTYRKIKMVLKSPRMIVRLTYKLIFEFFLSLETINLLCNAKGMHYLSKSNVNKKVRIRFLDKNK